MPMTFYRPRPSEGPVAQDAPPSRALASETALTEARALSGFVPIPFAPFAPYPYNLDLAQVLGNEAVARMEAAGSMTFHTAGDSGGVKRPEVQALVARGMERSFEGNPKPASFFYHLGDVVYFMGETRKYFDQFYDPYEHYPAPIFAIAGNHDGQTGSWNPRSLEGFQRNFCGPRGTYTEESQDTRRMAMCQPYAYWRLDTPLATFIGLYTNVPEGGEIDETQRKWFRAQLREAPDDRCLILALHHPIYSFDKHHSGSIVMARELEGAINESRRIPNLILTAHVHNVQRIEKKLGAATVPFMVIGNGGYWNLHQLIAEPGYRDPGTGATLVAATDKRHGFATIEVTRSRINGAITTVPRPHESWSDPAGYQTFDTFSYPATPIRPPNGETVRLA
jgi:hypothetical protein